MSEPIKLPVFIAICAAALVIFGLIGYKFILASNPPPRKIDATMQTAFTALEQAKAQKMAGGKAGTPPASAPHP